MTDGQRCVPCTNTWVTVLDASRCNRALFPDGNKALLEKVNAPLEAFNDDTGSAFIFYQYKCLNNGQVRGCCYDEQVV